MSAFDLKPARGMLLIAPPVMLDPNFRRSVILLCDHDEEGSFGLVLNRMLPLHLHEVLDDLEGESNQLALGGPVQPNTLHILHRHGDLFPKADQVVKGVFWSGDFDLIKAFVESEHPSHQDMRFFLGYAGWGPGQLQEEIEENSWMLTYGAHELVFPEDPTTLWRDVLRRMGGEYALLSNFPDDPRLN